MSLSAFFGSASEALAIFFGVWNYARADYFGIPAWLPFLWGLAGVFVVRVYYAISRLAQKIG